MGMPETLALARRVLKARNPWEVNIGLNEDTRDGVRVVVATAFASYNTSGNPAAPGNYDQREASSPIEYFGGTWGPLQDAQARALAALDAVLSAELAARGAP